MTRPKRDWFYKFCQWAMRVPYFRLMGGVEVCGLENIPATGAVIVAPIHVSNFDPPLVGCHIRRHVSFMAKRQLFEVPILGPMIRKLGSFPVERGGPDSTAVRRALALLEIGELLMLFPEGTRGDGQALGPIQSGMAMLARRSGAPIVPVGIDGTQRMLPRGAKRPRRAHCKLVFAEPFTFEQATAGCDARQARQAFTDELARRLAMAARSAGLEIKTGAPAEAR